MPPTMSSSQSPRVVSVRSHGKRELRLLTVDFKIDYPGLCGWDQCNQSQGLLNLEERGRRSESESALKMPHRRF